MYRKEVRIPTLFGITLVILMIFTLTVFGRITNVFQSSAKSIPSPSEVHFTNISDTTFTVSWLTNEQIPGYVKVADKSSDITYLDDLDSDNISRPRRTHQVTIKNLKENTSYKVTILSGKSACKKSCPSYLQSTAVKLPVYINNLPPIQGTILTADKKAAFSALVYLQVGKSAPLSARVDSQGLWVIPFNNVRTQDLKSNYPLSDSDIVQITAASSSTDKTTAIIDLYSVKQNRGIAPMQMGNTYNFIGYSPNKNLAVRQENKNIMGVSQDISILFPKVDNDTSTDRRPRLRGTGIPGTTLLITVNSTPQTGRVTVGSDGTWYFRPLRELAPGQHQISVSYKDANGNLNTTSRFFIVFKSGEQVLGESTPSATLTPTITFAPTITTVPVILTPSATPIPSSTPTPTTVLPTATIISEVQVEPPRTGTAALTYFIIGGGLALLITGARLLIQ